jgi:DNA-binding transcriptional regulator YiaG
VSTFDKGIGFEAIHCAACGVAFAMTTDYIKRRRDDHATFYCPSGHSNVYLGKSEAEQLRDQLAQVEHQRDRAKMTAEQVRQQRDAIAKAHRKMRIRVMNGVCPCCNRSFEDLRQHMATKHPDFGKPQTVRALREAFGMTQSAVAEEAGTKPAYVSLFENGRPVPVAAAESLNWWLERQGARA